MPPRRAEKTKKKKPATPAARKKAKAAKRKAAPARPQGDERAAKRVRTAPTAPTAATPASVIQEMGEPPASISLRTGLPVHLSRKDRELWISAAGGKSAARRGPVADQLRLLGSVRLRVRRPRRDDGAPRGGKSASAQLASLLGVNLPPASARPVHARWCGSQKEAEGQYETWDPKTGELRGQGFVLLSKLLKSLYDGDLLCEQDWACEMLEALVSASTPDRKLWGCPLLRVLGLSSHTDETEASSHQPVPQTARMGKGKARVSIDCDTADGRAGSNFPIEIKLHVYCSRLMFYLIANPVVHIIFSHLQPSATQGFQPVMGLETYPASFVSYGGTASPFSLQGVLKSAEHAGYRTAEQPKGIALELKLYQLQTLAWMIDMESLPRGINGLFWERRCFVDGDFFHYSPELGELRLEEPPMMHGGLLCDEMGLGKTLEVVSLIVSTLHMPPPSVPAALLPSRCTLVVVPSPLVSQWLSEINKSVGGRSSLKIAKYTTDELVRHDAAGSWKETAKSLALLDIVVTTYAALDKDSIVLSSVGWARIILDEMQEVRSSTTELAKKCERLTSPRRWMVSGTPLYDKISDLQGELYFLRVSPFGAGLEDGFWSHVIGEPWAKKEPSALDALQVLLKRVMCRHSKSQRTLDGTPILTLPTKSISYVPVDLFPLELAVYARIESLFVRELDRLDGWGSERESSKSVGQVALRLLREACISIYLLSGGAACPDQLKLLEEVCRSRARASDFLPEGEGGPRAAEQTAESIQLTRMTPTEAISRLGSIDRLTTDRQHYDHFHNAQHRRDFVMHANTTQRVHNRVRAFALEKLSKRIEEVEEKMGALERAERKHMRAAALCRWKWALERLKTGALLFRAPPTPHAVTSTASPSGLATGSSPADGEGIRSAPRGDLRWTWACRALYLRAREAEFAKAEEELEAAEASVRSPMLRNVGGNTYKNESEREVFVLRRPTPIIADVRTQEHVDFNRELLVGKIRPGVVVKVVSKLSQEDGPPNASESPAEDGDFLSVSANEAMGVPAGWVHNRPLLKEELVVAACVRAKLLLPSDSKRSGDGLQQLVKQLTQPLREARDKARKAIGAFPNYLSGSKRGGGGRGGPNVPLMLGLCDAAAEHTEGKLLSQAKQRDLKPYMDKLRVAESLRLDVDAVEQSGFQELFRLEQAQPVSATCPICCEGVGTSGNIVVTPCAHLYCKACIITWVLAQNVLVRAYEPQDLELGVKLCPCCRTPFSIASLIELLPQPDDAAPSAVAPAAASSSSSATAAASTSAAPVSSADTSSSTPSYFPAFTSSEIEALPLPVGSSSYHVRLLRCPSLPALLLGLMQAATLLTPGSSARTLPSPIQLSAKIERLVADLAALRPLEDGSARKAVVFSQHRAAIKHVDLALGERRVSHVTICKGDSQASLEAAVRTWHDSDCQVFLLHAGAAAAGLTLVAAQHVFLLEPFDKPGLELQALNRCHRIGQSQPVACTIYYARRTVEERALAFREVEQARSPGSAAEVQSGNNEAEAISLLQETPETQKVSIYKLRYLLGSLACDEDEDAQMHDSENEPGEIDSDEEDAREYAWAVS